ncbi:MAG: hypothetical protein O3B01_11365 [Planctomycetota bacterium]|nr:hypothetical protein [Planctomycetota bacterium]
MGRLTPAQGIALGQLFANSPNVVAKVREWVLELATSGKLVANEPGDQTASSLLVSVESQRAGLVAACEIMARTTTPVDQDERPFEVPSAWAWQTAPWMNE